MIGERIAVLSRRKAGEDGMGEPVYVWDAHRVDGALVRPLDGEDAADPMRPDGVRALYRVALPKGYSGPPLKGGRVALLERGMDAGDADGALRISGSPDFVRPCPTRWDVSFEVGRADG